MDDYSQGLYCPFYGKEKDGKLKCEAGTIRFPDRIARRELVYTYCASPDNYKNCTLCQMLMNYYERKEQS